MAPWKSETFSAHPKLDPLSGEMVSFGYEATGLASDDLYIATLDSRSRLTESVTVKVPYVSVIHDMALTHRHVVIPFGGYVTSPERLKAGKIHWGWDASKPSMIGVMPGGGRREGYALVPGSRALHDAYVQRAFGREQGHSLCAVLRFEFLPLLSAGGRVSVEPRQGAVVHPQESPSISTGVAMTGRRKSCGPCRWVISARWIHAC